VLLPLEFNIALSKVLLLLATATSALKPALVPASLAFRVACLKAMFPAIMLPVSTERIMPIPAKVIATNMISAMSRTTPRWLRGVIILRPLILPAFITASSPH
jgi:hypothetical protein